MMAWYLKSLRLTSASGFSFAQSVAMAEAQQQQLDDSAYPDDQANDAGLSHVVQGTAESMVNRLEENIASQGGEGAPLSEEELLQGSDPGPLDADGKDVEDVLNVISQSIYRAAAAGGGQGQGSFLMKLTDRTSLLSVVSHSLSAYITTLEPAPLQR